MRLSRVSLGNERVPEPSKRRKRNILMLIVDWLKANPVGPMTSAWLRERTACLPLRHCAKRSLGAGETLRCPDSPSASQVASGLVGHRFRKQRALLLHHVLYQLFLGHGIVIKLNPHPEGHVAG